MRVRRRWRVFVSHTSELRNHPAARSYIAEVERAVQAEGHVVVEMETFPAAGQAPGEFCADRVRSCDVYIGVLGAHYGSLVRGGSGVSYTELEFDTAAEAGLMRLMFLLDLEADRVELPPTALIDHQSGEKQAAFRERVANAGLTVRKFATAAELGQLVERSLRQLADNDVGAGEGAEGWEHDSQDPPRVWRMPSRNVAFTGREALVSGLRYRLSKAAPAARLALHGMGGVGKTQIAIEYSYRFAGEYRIVWWIRAEHPEVIAEQLLDLAVVLKLTPPSADTDSAVEALLDHLRRHDSWLLIFDNAEDPASLHSWLPCGPGHVLITSRHHAWSEISHPVPIDVFDRGESIALLMRHRPLTLADGEALAEALGDLPLAVAQAGGFLESTGLEPTTYLQELARHAGRATADSVAVSYPVSLAAAVRLSAARLAVEDAVSEYVFKLCAFMAPEPIPRDLFTGAGLAHLPETIAETLGSPMAFGRVLRRIASYGLMRLNDSSPTFHRLTQAIIRDDLPPAERRHFRDTADALLVAARPDDGRMPCWWARWARLLPHILAADPAGSANSDLRHLACSAVWQLHAQGNARAALPLAHHLYTTWRDRHGEDDVYTMFAASNLGATYRVVGDYERARDFDADTLDRRARVLGADHPHTLGSAHKLATDLRHLGDYAAALAIDERNLVAIQRVLGVDHHYAYTAACNLATDLRLLGRYQEARLLHERTLRQQRQHIGDDDPETLVTADELAEDLRAVGAWEESRALREDVLVRREAVLGEGHPYTMATAHALAEDFYRSDDLDRAHDLASDVLARRQRLWGDDHPATRQSASLVEAIHHQRR